MHDPSGCDRRKTVQRMADEEPEVVDAGGGDVENELGEDPTNAAPRILTIDDSRLVRAVITAHLNDSGYETLEADNGQAALDMLASEQIDLILLDIMMPNVDGPTFLTLLREMGNRTPVILLTGKTETKVIARCMRQGIDDYILKPVQQSELIKKVTQAVGAGAITSSAEEGEEAAKEEDGAEGEEEEKINILIVDDSEKVANSFRALLPEDKVTLEHKTSGEDALAACKDTRFNTVVIDTVIPGEDSSQLTEQIRNIQQGARVVALYLRNVASPMEQALQDGYDGYLAKPFDPLQVSKLYELKPKADDVLAVDDNVLKALPSSSGEDEVDDAYFSRLGELVGPAIEGIASDCFEKIVFDFSEVPQSEEFPIFVKSTLLLSRELGLQACVVGEGEALAGLKEGEVSAPVFASVQEVKDSGEWS